MADLCRTSEITETTFYRRKKQFHELGVSSPRESPHSHVALRQRLGELAAARVGYG